MTSPHLITSTGSILGGGTLFLALDGSNQPAWTPTTTLVPNLNADLLDGLNAGQFIRSDISSTPTTASIAFAQGLTAGSNVLTASTSTNTVGIGQAASSSFTLGITSSVAGSFTAPLNIAHTLALSGNSAGLNIAPTISGSTNTTTSYRAIDIDFTDTHSKSGTGGGAIDTFYGFDLSIARGSSAPSNDSPTIISIGALSYITDGTNYNRTSSNQSVTHWGWQGVAQANPQYNGSTRTLTYNMAGVHAAALFSSLIVTSGTVNSTVRGIWVETVTGSTSAGNTSTIYGIDVAGPTTGATAYGARIGAASASTTAYGLAIAKPITASTIYQIALDGVSTGSGLYFNTPTRAGLEYIRSTGTGFLNLGAGTSIKLDPLTSNGFVKTSGGDGTLSVDTTAYVSSISVTSPITTTGGATPTIGFDFSTSNTWTGDNTWQYNSRFNAGAGLLFGDLENMAPAGLFLIGDSNLNFDINTDDAQSQFALFGYSVDSSAQGFFWRYDRDDHNQLFTLGYQDNLDVKAQGAGAQYISLAISSSSGHIQLGEVSSSNTIEATVEVRGDDYDINIIPMIIRSGNVEPKNYFLEFRNGVNTTLASVSSSGAADFTSAVNITGVGPTLQFKDTGGDDWSLSSSSGTFRLTNVSDLTIVGSVDPTTYRLTWGGPITASTLSLSATSNQIVLQSAGITTTLTESGATSNKTITFPNLTGTVMLTDATQTVSGKITFSSTGGIELSSISPIITFTDTSGSEDDYSIGTASAAFFLKNVTDGTTELSILDNGSWTIGRSGATVGLRGDLTITKAIPAFFLTDSGGDDYTIDVGSTASLLRIRNVTDSTNAFQVSGTGEVAISTSYAPNTSQKLFVQDRTTSASAAARAAFSATQEVVISGAFTGGNQRGFLGGISFIADQNNIAGASLIGLEGGATISSAAGFTQTNVVGLFGTLSLSGGSTVTTSTAVGSYIVAGTNTVATTAKHFSVGSTGTSGGATITNLYGFYTDALTAGTNNYEGWMGTNAGWFFREAGNQINSSAAATLDIDATTTTNFRIGGSIEAVLTANTLTFNNGATDTHIDWTTDGQLDIGGGPVRIKNTLIAQASPFAPYASGYELSVQSAGANTYIEILNNAGANTGAFFGMETDAFALYNWQGSGAGSGNYPIVFYGGFGAGELVRFDLTGGNVFNDPASDIDFRAEGQSLAYMLFLDASSATENIALLTTAQPNWQSMDRGVFIGNASTVPTGNPTSGGFLYVEAGALKYRGSSGTITVVGPA